MTGFEKKLPNGEKDFYKINEGKAINLFGDGITLSGDLVGVDESKGVVMLKNYIERRYNSDGTSYLWENPGEFEFNVMKHWGKSVTTIEDRLGRIANYNRDLIINELEQDGKLRSLCREPLIIIPSVYNPRKPAN